ncbi:MAG: hypothetical protein DRN04_01980 [Thermoprotei archaeon]|nr:MAG: hypothetical protein DRN04_01980 [Thermoprotei archaeon]
MGFLKEEEIKKIILLSLTIVLLVYGGGLMAIRAEEEHIAESNDWNAYVKENPHRQAVVVSELIGFYYDYETYFHKIQIHGEGKCGPSEYIEPAGNLILEYWFVGYEGGIEHDVIEVDEDSYTQSFPGKYVDSKLEVSRGFIDWCTHETVWLEALTRLKYP